MAVLAQEDSSQVPCISQKTITSHFQALDTTTKQIRLIKLRVGEHGPPQCDMEMFDLSDAPPFTALSYTWGPVSPRFEISVNDEPVSVRKGLFRFLQAYDGDEYLWIDQICINQSNVLERNHQVRLMASIYSQCRSVVVWLGRLRTRPRAPIIFNNTKSVEALAILLQTEYFTRLWIVQEVLLAQHIDVLCSHPAVGNVWVSWKDMCRVAKHSREALSIHHVPSCAIALLREYGTQAQRTLEHSIALFSGSHCHDARDRIYGLMGLVNAEDRLVVDYRKSTHEVFLDVVKYFHILHARGLESGQGDIDSVVHTGEPPPPHESGPNDSFLRKTLINLSESLDFSAQHCQGLQSFLNEIWSTTINGAKTRGGYLVITSMGFRAATTICDIASCGHNDILQRFTCKSTENRDCWWYEQLGKAHCCYFPPLPEHVTNNELQENIARYAQNGFGTLQEYRASITRYMSLKRSYEEYTASPN